MNKSNDELYKATKPLVIHQSWGDLEELIQSWVAAETQVLLKSTDIGCVREAQGKVKAYNKLISLPAELKQLSK